jgi:dGTPase
MSMTWPQLLCADRLGRDGKASVGDPARSEFQRDADRITFSTAFRRLQDKTQVFPLAENDYVRTRLTHTLEVASVARSLATRVGGTLCERHKLPGLHASDFGNIVSAAALAHDLGNPPFGHSGEDAIRHWFAHSEVARAASENFTSAQRADLLRFEGNAQGFRLITRLLMADNRGGLQLTMATLGAFTKYPQDSTFVSASSGGATTKKFGFFQSEKEFFEIVAQKCALPQRSSATPGWARHPLAFLMEAADDICYRLIDFEDGFRLGHLRYDEVSERFHALLEAARHPRRLHEARDEKRRVQILRDLAIGSAIEECAASFLEHESALLAGSFDEALLETVATRHAWKAIQQRSVETIYSTPRGVEIEAAGFEVLGGLLDIFVAAVEDAARHGKDACARSRKLLCLLPPETRSPSPDGYQRMLQLLDFVSGMTDSYAVSVYKKVRGISVPGR